jgi:hypothetical protein
MHVNRMARELAGNVRKCNSSRGIFIHDTYSSLSIVEGCRLDGLGLISGSARFSLSYSVQTDSGASYPMGTRGYFPKSAVPGVETDHLPPSSAEVKKDGSIPPPPPAPNVSRDITDYAQGHYLPFMALINSA